MKARPIILSIALAAFGSVSANEGASRAIDLATALRLADADNTQIALAREKIRQAEAKVAQAKTLLLPDLTAGVSYHRHDGPLQETNGKVIDVDRSSSYIGGGAGAVGAGDVQVAGVALNVDLADAYYTPLAARQRAQLATSNSAAVRNQVQLEVATAWFELQRARGALQIAAEAQKNADALASATRSFAETGEGLDSDQERAAVEALVRKRDIEIVRENFEVRAIRLAWLLRIDPTTALHPAGSVEARTEWVESSAGLASLIDRAVGARPELVGSDAEIAATLQELHRRRFSPLIPQIAIGASGGAFGGDSGSSAGYDDGRGDVSAAVYWQLNGLGFGHQAEVDERESLHRQAQISRADVEIAISAEVAGAFSSVRHRNTRIGIARDTVVRAQRSYELNRSRVFENQGLPIEVLQAIQSLVVARSSYLDSLVDYNIAQFQLYTAVGQSGVSGAQRTEIETQVEVESVPVAADAEVVSEVEPTNAPKAGRAFFSKLFRTAD